MAKIESNQYGKCRVRVLKVHKGEQHEICELEADVLLRGDLEESYLTERNQTVVPTDTVKNTVQALAHDSLGTCRTSFAQVIGSHFLAKYSHLSGVSVELRERRWKRMPVEGKAHDHAFVAENNGEWFCRGEFARDEAPVLSAGVREHLVLKTTGSSFLEYHQCDLTTLPPAEDRILSTKVSAEWFFAAGTTEFASADDQFMAETYRVFAETMSPSVQRTLFQTGEAALAAIPSLTKISLQMPNVHFLGLDLGKLGRPDNDCVFLPTDEPHGEIEAVIARS